jgi:hypothetical protein
METAEYWERKFKAEKTTWGFTPSDSAILIKDFFLATPGKGYFNFLSWFQNFQRCLVWAEL